MRHHEYVKYCQRMMRRMQERWRKQWADMQGRLYITCCIGMLALLSMMASSSWVPLASATQQSTCQATLLAPVANARIIAAFDGPAQPWLAGHRGVDMEAKTGDQLRAPLDAVVSFVGSVAGKSVVSLRGEVGTLTFEPAATQLSVGASVQQGEVFAHVEGHSDHCDDHCVHWGVKVGNRQYRDPEALLTAQRIVLKPW
ncbi:peptidase, M23 family [Bifidobacterium gallicum DSM 20093 = LMG 11596]|nr:peptidase, M23 family [Bifidobacterium gallicum DSM 20093 = LMG 11596]